jgi:hypothetical protein
LLSRLDGLSSLEDLGEITALGFEKVRRLAERLVIVGAARPLGRGPSIRPKEEKPAKRIDPRAETVSIRPPKIESSRPVVEKPKRKSTKSLKAQKVEICELDAETQAKITELDRKIGNTDYYSLLGVARDADKKEIKRAYFALAATFHPDRFFGKKLGLVRAPLDRVFVKLTEANDTLGSKSRREAYDATLPPLPKRSIRPPKSVRPRIPTPPPTDKRGSKAPLEPRLSKKMRRSQMLAAVSPPPLPKEDPEKFKRLHAAAQMLVSQKRAERWVNAAEDAMKKGDILGAANNYRLALEMHDDPSVRDKMVAIDAHSRDLRHEKLIARARAAERAEKWDEAADQYVRANEVRKDPTAAERAANALRLCHGDLRLAATLAEQAVNAQTKNADYRVTLAEVYFAQKLVSRAKEECEAALSAAPDSMRAKALASALKK